ncbi:hypothetical protein O1611_g6518 [Lasiodiplodia mahajangana]|uniref:Uncharacterized protein n=1 Tax=Lasiodiplodia mahajangana TaxID=1108764 RepID=A0ACC2JID5_9PEZI|nr:hypothetical protein O1611_g6518 [Lasiodiplodia mahajangana]
MSSSHEKGRRSNVPKFASFKPKAQDTPTDNSERAENDFAQPSASHAHRRIPVEINATASTHASRASRIPQQPAERKLDGDGLYYLDKRGDALILRYGSNDRSRIPVYRRIGAGRILGADGFMKIEKLGSRDEFFIRSHHESGSLLSSDKKSLLTRGIRLDSQPIRIRRRPSETGAATEDYLSFKTSKKRKRDGVTSEESSSDEGPSYRSIPGKSKRHEHSDNDEEDDGDSSEGVSNRSKTDPIAMRSIELSRKVRQHPEDIESWFELVDHQNTLLDLQSGSRAPTAAEIKSFSDIKLSLLEQALSYNTEERHREGLSLKIIEEGLKVWEFKVALKKLAEIMQKYPNSFELWKLYMSFLQTTLSACRYDEIKRVYTEKLQSLGKRLLSLSTSADKIECSEQIIYIFLRLTRFLADAGFAELASAAWQASLELNLARPSTLPEIGWEIPPSFQDYWESEIPRLGEENWRGWTAFVTDAAAQEPPDPKSSSSPVPPNTRDGYKAWHATEHHRAQNATIPARTLDEGAEDDPFRVVMFSDFQDILLYFPTEIVPHIRPQLLDAFLIFCHLPPAQQNRNLLGKAAKDPFLVRSAQAVPFRDLLSRNSVDPSEEQQIKLPEFSYDIQQIFLTSEVLFPPKQWFGYMGQVRDKIPPDNYRWVTTTLKQLTRGVGSGELASYALAFESINDPGSEKKSAKALLKQYSFDVDLYLGYSILENERENKATARNVLSAAFGLPSIPAHDRVRLGIGAAWLELDDGDISKAVLQLCRLAEDGPKSDNTQIPEPTEATSSQILKAKQFLVTNRDYKISSGIVAEAVIYAEGLVLLDYLTQRSETEPSSQKQGDISSGISRITQFSDDLVTRGQQHSSSHEKFLQSSARLLYYHASHGSFRPGLLREQLARYLSYFPSNTIFLSLFAWREERLSINDRVRSLLQDHVLTHANESVSSHVFAISYELRTGNAHSTHAAFERALSPSAICAHHVGLWVAYIRFCHARKELRAKAKQVFYRAIQACPWAKDVFMEAFGTLVREMDSAELKSVYSTMCEKGFRIHVDMDEFVEKWRREQKGVDREKGAKSRKR